MGFANAIVGASGALLRAAIRSPNFVSGATGWTINQDGTVEFSAGTFRGVLALSGTGKGLFVYQGTPKLGSLAAAIATDFGTDQYGNNYAPGLSVYENTNNLSASPAITFYSGPGNAAATPGPVIETSSGALYVNGQSGALPSLITNTRGGGIDIDSQIGNTRILGPVKFNPGGNNSLATVQFGSGYPQQHYAEAFPIGTQAVAHSTTTFLTALTANILQNDYNPTVSQMSAVGVWTCPANGWYNFTYQVSYLAWVNGSETGIYIVRNGNNALKSLLQQQHVSGALGRICVSGRRHLSVGDTVRFIAVQYTGVTQNIDVGESSYISITQEF